MKKSALVLLIGLSAMGCGNQDADILTNTTATTRIRGIHAASNVGGLDAFVNDTQVARNTPYGSTTGFITPTAGQNRYRVMLTGQTTPLIDFSAGLSPDLIYSAFAVGQSTNNPLSPVLVIDNDTPPTAGNFKLRVIDGVVDAANINLTMSLNSSPTANPQFANLAFGAQSPAQLQPASQFPAGTYTLSVSLVGGGTIFRNSNVVVNAGDDLIYTVVVDPQPANSQVEVLATPLNGNPFVIESTFGQGRAQ